MRDAARGPAAPVPGWGSLVRRWLGGLRRQSLAVGWLLVLLVAPAGAESAGGDWSGWPWLSSLFRVHKAVLRAGEFLDYAPIRKAATELERVRHRRLPRPVAWKVLEEAELRRLYQEQWREDLRPGQLDLDRAMLGHLSLWPGRRPPAHPLGGLTTSQLDLEAFLSDLMAEQVMAAYDSRRACLYLVAMQRLKPEQQADLERLMVHELDHALQDQAFGLGRLQAALEGADSDRQLAAQSLFEGEATLLGVDLDLLPFSLSADDSPVSLARLGEARAARGTEQPRFDAAPLYYRRVLLFPYFNGAEFVRELRREGGWAAVERAYRRLPASSEQILHPEKYLAREGPMEVGLDPFPKRVLGWERGLEDTGGEFLIRTLLEQHGVRGYGEAGAGWGGDRYTIYRNQGRTALLWLTRWDSPAQAAEFAQAALSLMGRWTVVRHGGQVLLLESAPPELARRLLQCDWF